MIIDSHVHLNDPRFDDNLDKIIKKAVLQDVRKMIVIGYDKESSLRAIKIAKKYNSIYASVGIHPSEAGKMDSEDLDWLIECLKEPKVIAIGEIGLDYYWDTTYKEQQKILFKKQIEIAKVYNYPIIVHSREAINDTYECLKDSGVKGVLHCYSSSIEMAQKFIHLGYLLGVGGIITFKNAKLRNVVQAIDLDYLITETDAPYLTPEPYRGQTNEPQYVRFIVEEIAKLKNVDSEMVKQKIEENTFRIFGI